MRCISGLIESRPILKWENFNIFNFSDRKFLWSFFIAAVVIYTPLLIWNEWPQRDVAFRYAPMAEAFARGDFQYAFHPRCQMMLPLCAGIVCAVSGCSGLMGCKVAALAFFILGVFPLFGIAKTAFGRKAAIGAAVLYLLCFHIIDELVVAGVRDILKTFFLLWMSRELLMIFLDRGSWRHHIALGFSCGLSICVRGEMLFIAATVLLISGVLDGLKNRWLWRSALGLLCAVAGASAEILTNLAVSGYAIPSSRFVAIFQNAFHTDPTVVRFYLYVVLPSFPLYLAACHAAVFMLTDPLRKKLLCGAAAVAAAAAAVYIVRNTPTDTRGGLVKFFRGIHGGCAPAFYPPALLGLLTVLWQKRGNASQRLILSLFFLFGSMVVLQIIFHDRCYYVSSRYLLPAVPLILPWSAIGIHTLWELLKFAKVPYPRVVAAVSVAFAVVLAVYLGYRTEVLNHCREKEVKDWAIIQKLKRKLLAEKKIFYKPAFDISYYRPNVKPTVFPYKISYYSVSLFLAGCSETNSPNQADFIITNTAVGERGLRKQFGLKRKLRRINTPIPSRRGDLIILEIVK